MDKIAKLADILDQNMIVVNCSQLNVAGTMYFNGQQVNGNHVVSSVKISDLNQNQDVAIQISQSESGAIIFLIGLLDQDDIVYATSQAIDSFNNLNKYADESRKNIRQSAKFKECKEIRGILLDANYTATQIWYDLFVGLKFANLPHEDITSLLENSYPGYERNFYENAALTYSMYMR